MAWLSDWSYRKEISITGQSGAGTDYQVVIDIGDSAGGDFHLEGNCTSFPQDIEVTDDDGTTLLDFWIEDTTADPIKMWVEVADDLGSNQTIYIYYGKDESPTSSNGANTFIQYHGAATATFVDSYNVTPTDIAFEVYGKVTSATHNIKWGLKNTAGLDETDDLVTIGSYNVDDKHYFVTKNEGTLSYVNEIPAATVDVLQRMKIIIAGSTWHAYVDGDEVNTGISTNLPDEDMGLTMYLTTGTAGQDWSFVRKYNSPEPAFSSAGSEETPAVDTSTDLLHGKIIIKDSSIILVDGLIQVKDSVTDLFDGGIKVIEKVTSLADGKLQVQDVATSLTDGKLQVKDSATTFADGKVQIQDIDTNLADGKLQVQDVDTDLADGIIQVKDSITSLADGKVQIQDTDIDLADGKVKVQDSATGLADGLLRVQDKATGLADGKVQIQDTDTDLADGKVIVTTAGIDTGYADGKIQIKDVATGIVDGLIKVKDSVTGLVDGKVQVKDSVTNLIDGKVIVSTVSTATGLADGNIQIKDVATGIVDGLLKIVVAIRRISIGNLKPSFRLITKNQKPSYRLVAEQPKSTYRLKTENK